MIKIYTVIALTYITLCSYAQNRTATPAYQTFNMYSTEVRDTFSISVRLPVNYKPNRKKPYPVVYLLDANIYFDIIATTLNKYQEIGLAPAVILVGIGYKDFPTLDSLRNRDDTYPVAIPEYEMSVSGGADKFLSFISKDLIPRIDRSFHSDSSKRVIMGHSLAGYFALYTLMQDLSGKTNMFNGYIAASPSVHYNHYYFLDQLKQLPPAAPRTSKIKSFITFGGDEDYENKDDSTMTKTDKVLSQLKELLGEKQNHALTLRVESYSNLGHMDTQIPTFIKGLRWFMDTK
ncbi:MAG: alpha/beta hydrolase [Bacteroidetes bacterium]|nr:alpha/beta hydrolase [Bacteroidota bacterium]